MDAASICMLSHPPYLSRCLHKYNHTPTDMYLCHLCAMQLALCTDLHLYSIQAVHSAHEA